jgi:hypothetical protein
MMDATNWTSNGIVDIGVTEDGILIRRHDNTEATLRDGVAFVEWPLLQMLVWEVREGHLAEDWQSDLHSEVEILGYRFLTGFEWISFLLPLRRLEFPNVLRELKAERPVIELAQRFMPHVGVPPMLLIEE